MSSLRIAYVDFDGAEALRRAAAWEPAGQLDDRFLRQCCAPVLEGVDRLAAWIAEV